MIDKEVYKLSTKNDFYGFEFTSEGTKGKIEKIILFTPTPMENVYNLGFGDYDAVSGQIDDNVVSNNGDTKKILATVANSVLIFTEKYPDFSVVATGVTPARTRLYRMGIQEYWTEISANFYILGFKENYWEEFIPNQPYEAFLVKRKK